MTNRWLLLNFDALGALAVLITTLFALSGFVDAGTAALYMTSAMTFTQSIYWACRYGLIPLTHNNCLLPFKQLLDRYAIVFWAGVDILTICKSAGTRSQVCATP